MLDKSFPLFVVGYGRSGTTLLLSILNAHPAISLANEANIVLPLLRAKLDFADPHTAQDLARRIVSAGESAGGRARRFVRGLEGLAATVEREGATTLARALELALRNGSTRPIWGEKSLQLCFGLRPLLTAFPNARIVAIVRDPRDVALSFFRKRHEERKAVPNSIRHWHELRFRARQWELYNRALEATLPATALRLRYEDLVEAPADMINDICGHLGLAPSEQMLDPSAWPREFSSVSAHERLRDPIGADRLGTHALMSETLIKCVEDNAPSMGRYGYARRTSPRLSLTQIALSARHVRARWRAASAYRELAPL